MRRHGEDSDGEEGEQVLMKVPKGAITTGQGAIDWFNAQKKKKKDGGGGGASSGRNVADLFAKARKTPPPKSEEKAATPAIPLPRSKRQVTQGLSEETDAVAMLAKKFPSAMANATVLSNIANTTSDQSVSPPPQQQQSMPLQTVQQVMLVPVQGQQVIFVDPSQQQQQPQQIVILGQPQQQQQFQQQQQTAGDRRMQQQGQNQRRKGGRRQQQQQQQPQLTEAEAKRMMEEQQALIEEQMAQLTEQQRDNPEFQRWLGQQRELQSAHETTRMHLFGKYKEQGTVSQEKIAEGQGQIDVNLILELIDKHQVTFICSDTGSGKSTSVPKALLELSAETKIVSTQPRRTATVSIAQRVAMLRGEEVGGDVGYWIRGEKCGDETTRLWYMTSYTLLLQLLGNPLKPPFTHIILDEFHERQPDLEVTMALLKLCLINSTADFKVIIMSATLDTTEWDSYFNGISVAVYKQSEPEHPIHDFFMEEVSALVGMPYTAPEHFTPLVADHLLVENHLFVAQHLVMFINMIAVPSHSVLIFLPGRAQVEHFALWLQMNMRDRVDPIPWHSAIDLTVIHAAIKRKATTRQKVYIATDIAEVSITLPDVVFVIDLALVKRPQMIPSQNASILFPPLMTQWISRGSIAQRRGRVGRVQQGFYFCLLPQTFIEKLQHFPSPPIQHSRIDELALHCLQITTNPVAIFSICRGQPLMESISTSMNTLSHLGCIMPKKDKMAALEQIEEVMNVAEWSPVIMAEAQQLLDAEVEIEEYVCTFLGRLLQLIPVSAQPGMLIFYGFITGLESLTILAAAVANSLSPFSANASEHDIHYDQRTRRRGRPESIAQAMEAAENRMKEYSCELRSDLVATMGAVIKFRMKQKELDLAGQQRWCRNNSLSYEKLMSIVDLERHIKYELAGFVPFRDIENPYDLATQLQKVAPVIAVIACAAFASQSLQVTTEGSTQFVTKESAVGLFTELKAMPDLHSPSCFRWEHGDIVVPVTISLRYSSMLVSGSSSLKSPKQFFLALLLFAHRILYATFQDEQGMYTVFKVTFCGTSKYYETDAQTGAAVIEFRKFCSRVCATLRLRFSQKDMDEIEFDRLLISKYNLPTFVQQQREVMQFLYAHILGPAMEHCDVTEVEPGDDELDNESVLSFAIPVPLF